MNGIPEKLITPQLHEVVYPNDLRSDGAAVTYVDSGGNTYLEPLTIHDYEASRALYHAGLSSGEVVEVPGHAPLIRYGADADLIPLRALLNSSIEDEAMVGDIATAVQLVGLFFRRAERKCNISPAAVTYDMFAIDKGNARAEPLPPFFTGESVVAVPALMGQLKNGILNNCKSDLQRERIENAFRLALERLGDL